MDNKLAEKVITEARVYSEKYGCIIRVLSNGKTLTWYMIIQPIVIRLIAKNQAIGQCCFLKTVTE